MTQTYGMWCRSRLEHQTANVVKYQRLSGVFPSMNKHQLTFIIVAGAVFTITVMATTWALYRVYEAPARDAAELQADMNSEYMDPMPLKIGENYGMQETVDGKTLQGN